MEERVNQSLEIVENYISEKENKLNDLAMEVKKATEKYYQEPTYLFSELKQLMDDYNRIIDRIAVLKSQKQALMSVLV